jgi:hypothetical protein
MSAGWPIIGNYTFVHLEFNCLYRFFTISSSTSHCSTLYVASLYQNSCFRSWLYSSKSPEECGGCLCLFDSMSEIAGRGFDICAVASRTRLSIANAQDKDRADAAAAALRPLSTFIDSIVKSSLLLTSCRSVNDNYCI